MSGRLNLRVDLHSDLPAEYRSYSSAKGETVSLSVSSATTRIQLLDRTLIRKRYVYSLKTSIKAALRNTLFGPSRAAREFRMLMLFRERLGPLSVPEPIAFGEMRSFLLLREAMLITMAVPGATTLEAVGLSNSATARSLGEFLARLHRAGLVHGSLFARNLLKAPDGSFRFVDLDHAEAHAPTHLPPLAPRARDLAFLDESVEGSREVRFRALSAYARAVGERSRVVGEKVANYREEARTRLDRRKRERSPERRPASAE